MTVEELIKHLQCLPADTPVLVDGYENGYDEIVEVREMEVFQYKTAQEWDGEYQMTDAPMPQAVQDWDKMELVGREKFEDSPFQGEVSEWPTKRTKQ